MNEAKEEQVNRNTERKRRKTSRRYFCTVNIETCHAVGNAKGRC